MQKNNLIKYSPFGASLQNRSFSSGAYRYGFNGQEKDDEVAGTGNIMTAEYWEYDIRLGRRWDIDPIVKPSESSYSTFLNSPIIYSDPLGLDTFNFNHNSWSAPAPKSGLDGVNLPAPGGVSNSINIVPAEGEHVFLYNQSHTSYDANGVGTTTNTTTQFFPKDNNLQNGYNPNGEVSGITCTPWAFGCAPDRDLITLAKLAPTSLLESYAGGSSNDVFRGAIAMQKSLKLYNVLNTAVQIAGVIEGGYTLFSGYRSFVAMRNAAGYFEGATYSQKVMTQMSKAADMCHSFPKSVDGFAAKYGQWTTKVGANGQTYQWLKIQGSFGGKTGTFEYIKDANGLINHRFFNVTR